MSPGSPIPPPSGPSSSYCRFTAGRGAAPADGTAWLGLTGVEIDLGHGEPRRIWRYATLRVEEPIRPNAIDVLLSSSEEPRASLFVQGAVFAADLRERAPHLSARVLWARRRRILLAFLVLAAALVLASYLLGWSPAKSIAQTLPDSWRERLGDAARESMTEGHKECVDPAGLAALGRLTERLSKGASVSTPFKIHVYDWSLMNAFAVPGGEIV